MMFRKPQRLTKLFLVEKNATCVLTWQAFGNAMWKLAIATPAELNGCVLEQEKM